jgi:hypothetical protein
VLSDRNRPHRPPERTVPQCVPRHGHFGTALEIISPSRPLRAETASRFGGSTRMLLRRPAGRSGIFWFARGLKRDKVVTSQNLRRTLVELRRVLRPDGLLLLAFHNDEDALHLDEWWGQNVCVDFFYSVPTRSRRTSVPQGSRMGRISRENRVQMVSTKAVGVTFCPALQAESMNVPPPNQCAPSG